MRKLFAVLALALFLPGCAIFGEPVGQIAVPKDISEVGQQAANAVNEAYVALIAANNLIKSNVDAGIYTKEQAQRYLDRSKVARLKVDAAKAAFDATDYTSAVSQANITKTLLLALQREVAAQARKDAAQRSTK